jgi:hypothetical protein
MHARVRACVHICVVIAKQSTWKLECTYMSVLVINTPEENTKINTKIVSNVATVLIFKNRL